MLQLFFNDDNLISITGDEDILSRIPDSYECYEYYNLINIKNELVTTEHLVEAFEYALRKKGEDAVNAAAYYAKLKDMYETKKRLPIEN